MSRRKSGEKVDGWVVLDKPAGVTSTQAVAAVRRLFAARKAGHGGTLDPLASGLLPIALGEATKTVPYVMDGAKTYRFTLRFGEARATDDAEGAVTARCAARPDEAAILAALPRFVGEIEQVPPAFSAIRIEGRRAYDLARAGESLEMKPRRIRIDDFRLIERSSPDLAVFEVRCGKGAYMRALARDLALSLGSLGHVAQLRRLAVGPFTLARAISLDSLQALGHREAASEHLLPVETALDDIPALALSATEAGLLRSGQRVGLLHRQDRDRIRALAQGEVVRAMTDGRLLAIARFEAGELIPVRVINL